MLIATGSRIKVWKFNPMHDALGRFAHGSEARMQMPPPGIVASTKPSTSSSFDFANHPIGPKSPFLAGKWEPVREGSMTKSGCYRATDDEGNQFTLHLKRTSSYGHGGGSSGRLRIESKTRNGAEIELRWDRGPYPGGGLGRDIRSRSLGRINTAGETRAARDRLNKGIAKMVDFASKTFGIQGLNEYSFSHSA